MKYPSSLFAGFLGLFLAGLLLFYPEMAFAEGTVEWNCSDKGNLNQVFCGITSQFRFIPQVLAVFAYAIAVFLAVTALMQLKQYGDDPSRTSLPGIIVRLVLAVSLISLPFAIQIFVTTLTGTKSINEVSSTMTRDRPKLGDGVSGK